MRCGASWTVCLAAWLLVATAHAQTDPGTGAVPVPTDPDPTAVPAPLPPARAPKVAIVIAGDPDPSMVAAASALETILATSTDVTMPSDPAMRAALRGEGTGDGLDEVRVERRHLGLGEARDVTALTVLGEVAGADLVIVVRSSHGTPQATAFDVLRRSFYGGELPLEPVDVEHATRFVTRRAQRAARPLDPDEAVTPPTPPTPIVDPATAVPPEAIAADPEQPAHQPDFFEQYWPYFAAGALLVGAVVFIVFATQNNGTPPPVLRFEAGNGGS